MASVAPPSYPSGADRRGWLIISRREAIALLQQAPGPDLERAQRQLRLQLTWIEHGHGSERPSITRALRREETEA